MYYSRTTRGPWYYCSSVVLYCSLLTYCDSNDCVCIVSRVWFTFFRRLFHDGDPVCYVEIFYSTITMARSFGRRHSAARWSASVPGRRGVGRVAQTKPTPPVADYRRAPLSYLRVVVASTAGRQASLYCTNASVVYSSS